MTKYGSTHYAFRVANKSHFEHEKSSGAKVLFFIVTNTNKCSYPIAFILESLRLCEWNYLCSTMSDNLKKHICINKLCWIWISIYSLNCFISITIYTLKTSFLPPQSCLLLDIFGFVIWSLHWFVIVIKSPAVLYCITIVYTNEPLTLKSHVAILKCKTALRYTLTIYHGLQSISSVCSGESDAMAAGEMALCHAYPPSQRWLRRAGMIRREAVLSRVMSRVTWSRLSPATASPFTCRISSPMPRRPV